MKKITLFFHGLGYEDFFQAYVKIYDQNNNIIFNGVTCSGKIKVSLELNKVYRIFAHSCGKIINTVFYVKGDYCCYNFCFNRVMSNKKNTVTLLLTDYYYNLPIEKGEIILG